MSEHKGYKGKIHDFLISNKIEVGDLVKITSELTYSGILMPRYESGDENHIVLKLKSGYNIGIEVEKIEKIEKIGEGQSKIESSETIEKDEKLPKILLLSTGGTIASKVDYRTGAVTPALSASELYEAVPEIAKIANVDAEVLFSEYSENLQPKHWLEIAKKLSTGAQSAIRWTKYALNNWYRMAGPAFDASTALEMLGFTGPEAREGMSAHLEKRKPNFPSESPV